MPVLGKIYSVGDGIFEIFRLKEARLSYSTVTNMFNSEQCVNAPYFGSGLQGICITLAQFFAEVDEPEKLTEEQRILFSR